LKKRGITPQKTVQLALTADEEWGYRGAKTLLGQGFFDQTDFLIIAESTNLQVAVGEKGELWIKAKYYGKSAHGSTPELGINTVIPGSKFVLELKEEFKKLFHPDPLWGNNSIKYCP
jgi:succinyl-diaminopimelate desuccinylase